MFSVHIYTIKLTYYIYFLQTDIEFEMYTDAAEQKIKASIKSMKMYSSIYGSPLYENSVSFTCHLIDLPYSIVNIWPSFCVVYIAEQMAIYCYPHQCHMIDNPHILLLPLTLTGSYLYHTFYFMIEIWVVQWLRPLTFDHKHAICHVGSHPKPTSWWGVHKLL